MIILNKIHKKYGELTVFEDYSITLQENKINCIMGQSGSGKTTLVRMLLGLETPDSGDIVGIDGLKASAVFQEDRLCENLDVYSNVVMPHIDKDSFQNLTKAVLDDALRRVDLADCGKKKVSTLSGGMKRRVAVLRAILAEYDFLILDEPFKGLDDKTKAMNIEFLLEKTQGKTVIFITHDKTELELMKPDLVVRL